MMTATIGRRGCGRGALTKMAGVLALWVVVAGGAAGAPQPTLGEQLVGTWLLVSSTNTRADGSTIDTFGSGPKGVYVFDHNGHVSLIQVRSDLPKFAANNRTLGTAEENKAVILGSIAYFGTYTVDEGGKSATIRIDAATFPNWAGTSVKRGIAISGDELTVSIPGGSAGGTAQSKWRRIK